MSTSFVVHNQLDDLQFHDVLHASTILRRYLNQGAYLFNHYDDLMKDIFLMLYKMTLILSPQPIETHALNYQIILQLKQSYRVGKLRGRTKGALAPSYIAMKYVLDGLFEQARGRIDLQDLQQKLKDLDALKRDFIRAQLETLLAFDALDNLVSQDELEQLKQLSHLLEQSGTDNITEITPNNLLMQISEFAFSNDDQHEETKFNQELNTVCETPPKAEKSPMTELLERLVAENTVATDVPDMKTVEDSEDLEALAQITKTDSDAVNEWRSELKKDLTEKLAPFLKEQYLTEGSGKTAQQQTVSELTEDAQVDQRIIDELAFDDNFEKEPEEIRVEQIDQHTEDKLRATGNYSGAGAGTSKKSSVRKQHLQILTEQILTTEKHIDNIMQQLDFEDIIEKSVDAIDHFTDTIVTLGIHEDSLSTLGFDDVIAMHRRFKSPQFIDFINRVGRNKLYAQKLQYKKRHAAAIPIEKVTTSHHLDLMIDDEFIGLALDIEAFENDFYDRFLQDSLLTFELITQRDRRKGPIILCYDGSGSMEGQKIEETRAHIISIMEIARIQRRKLVLIQFASRTEPLYIKTINPLFAKAQDVLDVLDSFICGGTDFEKPLSKAIEFIQSDPRRKSDILFITDGQCEIRKQFKTFFMALKRERKFKLYTIIMHSYTYQDYGDIGEISDEVLDIRRQDSGNWNDESNRRLYTLI